SPHRPGPPELTFEIARRLGPDGNEPEPLDEAAVHAAARALKGRGIAAIAVVLLHSYANAVHERRVGEILRAELADALVSLSCDVLPTFREYERSMTTILNAFVMPVVASYVAQLDRRVTDEGMAAPLLLMHS